MTTLSDRTLNLGILAHVDAGKTSLTERLLFDHGAIPGLGSVDAGSARTDSGELERERGITIRTAVAAFAVGDLRVNLVDTPGHPDFVAEVERALSVLDGAVLVLSAVEGVQAQTRVLMRTLRRLRLPTLLFVNKIDRPGARHDALLAEVRRRLTPYAVPLGTVTGAGTPGARTAPLRLGERAAQTLAEHDDDLLARLVDGAARPGDDDLRDRLARQTAAGVAHPLWFGSALTGEGTAALTDGIRTYLRPPVAPDGEPRGTVFAVERPETGDGSRGRKVAYVRMTAGEVRERRRITLRRREPGGAARESTGRITGIEVVRPGGFDGGPLRAGEIGRVRGLDDVRVGDRLGGEDGDPRGTAAAHFAPPALEAVVRPAGPGGEARLWAALTTLADEDPLIRVRRSGGGAISLLLYGAVQREVIAARLRRVFGVDPVFEGARPLYVERPTRAGEALTVIDGLRDNPFWATVGVRIEPAPRGAGVTYVHADERGIMPAAFVRATEDAVLRTLGQGVFGWEVTDCVVTVFRARAKFPESVAADFRGLAPMVVLRALRSAGSAVFEPCRAVDVEVPADTLGEVIGFLAGIGAELGEPRETADGWLVPAGLPVLPHQRLVAALPGLTRGEGTVLARPGADRPVRGAPPVRERTDGDPLDPVAYLRFLADRSLAVTAEDGRWMGTRP
ncbi:GTP-binding protein [Streptomyces sp. RFCAC02]|uniref:GTP-binding protein n=1 Tax=Streptomyces sp. RFCAC02 TaxID=2499143 RepID=UPI001F0EE53F|nr:GTP-binding protein [Streptomyces sp. RFCAC02]